MLSERYWIARVERKPDTVHRPTDIFADCKADITESGALRIIQQVTYQTVAGYARDEWRKFTNEHEPMPKKLGQ